MSHRRQIIRRLWLPSRLSRQFALIVVTMSLAVCTPRVHAGMPSIRLTDIASLRIQTVSFFLVLTLVSAWGIKGLWNGLAKDFPRWPKLTYRGALSGTILWGLLFLVVLTMISGARELMTPGAWEKNGFTYQLASQQQPDSPKLAPEPVVTDEERRRSLDALRSALWGHAAAHDAAFPESPESAQFSEDFWRQPGDLDIRYHYVPSRRAGREREVLAFENAVYGDGKQWILYTDGSIETQPVGTVKALANNSPDRGDGG